MPTVPFDRQIDQFRKQIYELVSIQPGDGSPSADDKDVLKQALLSSLEELSVAGEELREQNEELILARGDVEKERNRYADLFNSAPDGYLVMTADGVIIEANRAASLLFNQPEQYIVGNSIFNYIEGKYTQIVHARLRSIREGREYNRELDIPLTSRGAQLFEAEVTMTVSQDETGSPISLRWLIRDVTERHRAEKLLFESEMRFHAIFDSANLGIVVIDLDGRVQSSNPAMQRLLKYPESDLRQKLFQDLIFSEDTIIGANAIRQLANGNQNRIRTQLRLINQHGEEVWVHLAFSSVRERDGRPQYLILMAENISFQKKMEAELIDVERRLTDAADVERIHLAQELHDGPLQDLYGIMYQLKLISLGKVDAQTYGELDRARELLQRTIDQLRNTTGGLRPPTLTHFGLERAIRSYVDVMLETTPNIDIHLELDTDNEVLNERTRTALFRIAQQGLINVVRHSAAQHATIRFHYDEQHIRLEIEDDGVGFHVPRHWIELMTSGHYGLVGAAERAVSVGGRLRIHSTPGAGTVLQVIVPRREGDQVQKQRLSVQITEETPFGVDDNLDEEG
jgi:PAS domain S-box-containing protein